MPKANNLQLQIPKQNTQMKQSVAVHEKHTKYTHTITKTITQTIKQIPNGPKKKVK